MAKRWFRLEIDGDVSDEQYAHLAHAAWYTAHSAGTAAGFDVIVKNDGVQSVDDLNLAWEDLHTTHPWRD